MDREIAIACNDLRRQRALRHWLYYQVSGHMSPKPMLVRRASSQAEELGLTKEAAASKQVLKDALAATKRELEFQKQGLEKKRSLVLSSAALSTDRILNQPMKPGLHRLTSGSGGDDNDDEEEKDWDDDDDENVDDLRDVLEQSDIAVGHRLSRFLPDSARASMAKLMDEREAIRVSVRHSSVRHSSTRPSSARHGAATPGSGGSSRLHAVCVEMVETEQRYHRDISLIVHTFVQGLRRTSPDLIQPLVANAEQLLQLHTALAERMGQLVKTHSGVFLAEALGSELLAVSPYLVMYVSYCVRAATKPACHLAPLTPPRSSHLACSSPHLAPLTPPLSAGQLHERLRTARRGRQEQQVARQGRGGH